MPAPAGRSGRGAVLGAAVLVLAALVVVTAYVGLPLALAVRALLGALPQALVLAAALVALATVGVLAVLRRTALVLRPRRGRRDALRHGRSHDRPAGVTAPPDRRALPHAGPTAPPQRRQTVHAAPGSWAPDAAGRHRPVAGRGSRHGARRR
jgi:hypothetical protein